MTDPVLDVQQNSIPSLLTNLTFENDLHKKLNAIDVILNAVDDDTSKKVGTGKLKTYLHRNYLDDVAFVRKLKMYSKMTENTELAMEYFGQDYISHSEFFFDEEFEETLAVLNKRLNRIIGILLKEYQTGEKVEF